MFICSGKPESRPPGLLGTITTLLLFQGSGARCSLFPRGDADEVSGTLNAAVMRRFERVVALPDPKIVISPAESTAWKYAGSSPTLEERRNLTPD